MFAKHKQISEYRNEFINAIESYIKSAEIEAERRGIMYFSKNGFGHRSMKDSVLSNLGVYRLKNILKRLSEDPLSEVEFNHLIQELSDSINTIQDFYKDTNPKNQDILNRYKDLVRLLNRFKPHARTLPYELH
ncbi:MAG: hypothetical protein N3C61_02785 [Candidatus Micrarchaeota archaeon]|nr:hypothetical protein [Candidatus Micrarchaeota archaeon]